MVTVHEIAVDGYPDMDRLTNRVAFIFDGCIVSGWPLDDGTGHYWESDSDVGRRVKFYDVTHWVEFPAPLHDTSYLRTVPHMNPDELEVLHRYRRDNEGEEVITEDYVNGYRTGWEQAMRKARTAAEIILKKLT